MPEPGAAGARVAVDIVYMNAGGGHRASAVALQAALGCAEPGWAVRLVNLRELLDPRDGFRRVTGIDPEALYNKRLACGWTFGLAHELKVLQALIRLGHPALVRRLGTHWASSRPDLVVSVIPNFNAALCDSLAAACPGVPYVTLLTDLADHPPRFWIAAGRDQHLVCGSDRAVAQARSAGVPAERIHATSGMVIGTSFYADAPLDRSAERSRHGLDAVRPTGLVLFGGQGSKAMQRIAERLPDVQLILACGHNAALAAALRRKPARAPRLVLGFTPDMARVMQLADFFIGKPGPGSVSEAVQMGLPVIVACNRWILPQERYNAEWVRAHGLGRVMPNFRQVGAAVDDVVGHLDRYRAATRALRNRAVFELPGVLRRILERAGVTPPTCALPTLQRPHRPTHRRAPAFQHPEEIA